MAFTNGPVLGLTTIPVLLTSRSAMLILSPKKAH
jgi:hypothetical protein